MHRTNLSVPHSCLYGTDQEVIWETFWPPGLFSLIKHAAVSDPAEGVPEGATYVAWSLSPENRSRIANAVFFHTKMLFI